MGTLGVIGVGTVTATQACCLHRPVVCPCTAQPHTPRNSRHLPGATVTMEDPRRGITGRKHKHSSVPEPLPCSFSPSSWTCVEMRAVLWAKPLVLAVFRSLLSRPALASSALVQRRGLEVVRAGVAQCSQKFPVMARRYFFLAEKPRAACSGIRARIRGCLRGDALEREEAWMLLPMM